jgi:hypothetical protein
MCVGYLVERVIEMNRNKLLPHGRWKAEQRAALPDDKLLLVSAGLIGKAVRVVGESRESNGSFARSGLKKMCNGRKTTKEEGGDDIKRRA